MRKAKRGVRDVTYPRKAFKETLKMLTWENIKFKLLAKLLY
ncbi:MAG: hypothetical protein QXK95_03050 [Nitrososphaerota archaeon]